MSRNRTLARAIGVAIAANSLALPVFAQDRDQAEPTALEGVAVTGSRIQRDVYTSSEPLDVIAPAAAAARGVGSVSALLQSSTVAAGSPQVTAASSTAFVEAGGTGAETLSLRGLGANRTLVLLNGRRAGPAGVRGEVSAFDFNVLPLSVIERVEVLKDGASSIYGSDAVAGVVNIITKKGEGATADGFVSVPTEDGGEESRFNLSWGKRFERGYLRVTADYHEEKELARGDRRYFRCGEMYVFDPSTGARADAIDPRTDKPACTDLLWGHVWVYDYADPSNVPSGALLQYDFDNDLGQYVPPLSSTAGNSEHMRVPPGWFPVAYDRPSDSVANADHPFQDAVSLIPETERATIFVEGEFDLTDNVTAYAEVLLNRRETYANLYTQYWTYVYSEDFAAFSGDPPSPGSGDPKSAGWSGAQWLSPTPITDHADEAVDVEYRRVAAGLRGKFAGKWNWDVSLQYSESDGDYTNDRIFFDSIADQWFATTPSCVGEVTSIRGAPCVDVPWFDPDLMNGIVSPAVRDFLFGRETGNTKYEQWSAEAYVSGPIWELPAGPLSIAFGIHYQEDEIRDVPGEITLAENVWGATVAGITAGDDDTKAVFAEAQIPILRNRPLVEFLTLTASGRYTDVASYGTGETYKVGLNWGITPSLRLRANQGTSFRTPALFELYLADQTSFLGQRFVDPCIEWGAELAAGNIPQRVADNCAADGIAPDFQGDNISATIITGGGLGVLEAETSLSRTIGLVWQPGFANLSVSVDYFDIEVKDEVDQLGAAQIVFGCYNSAFFPTDPLCGLFDRTGLLGGVENIRDSFINVARQRNRGWDVSALYTTPLPWGDLTIETQHTFQEEDTRALFEETAEDLNGEFGDPEWVGRLSLTFDRGPWSFFWGMDFVGSVSNHESFGGDETDYFGETVRVVLRSDAVVYHSASVSYEFENLGLVARLGASNLFDEEPPRVTTMNLGELDTIGDSAFYSQYDWLGRRLFLHLTKDF